MVGLSWLGVIPHPQSEMKCHQFGSQSGHVPGLQVLSPIRVGAYERQLVNVPLP